MKLPASIFETPALFPEKIDLQNKKFHFCNMTSDSYLRSPFLDHRIVKKNSDSLILEIDQLIAENPVTLPGITHYVFHSAFCCSTLFSRCLNAVESALVLREPNILMELASIYRFSGTRMLPSIDNKFLDGIFELLSGLMARRFDQYGVVVIKPTDAVNNIMAQLLEVNSGNRGLIIYSDVEHFLTAIFKRTERGEWIKVRAVELSLDEMKLHGGVKVNPETLNAHQKAALVWVLHMNKFNHLVSSAGGNVKTINNEIFMASPVEVVQKYLDFLGVEIDEEKIEGPVLEMMKGHSKSSKLSYSNEQREQDYLTARKKYDSEIKESVEWAKSVFGKETLECRLGNELA